MLADQPSHEIKNAQGARRAAVQKPFSNFKSVLACSIAEPGDGIVTSVCTRHDLRQKAAPDLSTDPVRGNRLLKVAYRLPGCGSSQNSAGLATKMPDRDDKAVTKDERLLGLKFEGSIHLNPLNRCDSKEQRRGRRRLSLDRNSKGTNQSADKETPPNQTSLNLLPTECTKSSSIIAKFRQIGKYEGADQRNLRVLGYRRPFETDRVADLVIGPDPPTPQRGPASRRIRVSRPSGAPLRRREPARGARRASFLP